MSEGVSEETVYAEWSVHLVRKHPLKLIKLLALILLGNGLLLLLIGWGYFQALYLFVLANLIMLGAVSDYLFPIRFAITSEHARYRNLLIHKQIAWADVKNCYISDSGVKLSPLQNPGVLENFRGFVLLFNDNREEIISHVKRLATDRTTEPS